MFWSKKRWSRNHHIQNIQSILDSKWKNIKIPNILFKIPNILSHFLLQPKLELSVAAGLVQLSSVEDTVVHVDPRIAPWQRSTEALGNRGCHGDADQVAAPSPGSGRQMCRGHDFHHRYG